ncbi:MAG: LysM peptidoglycan-binding domain-containing protein [Leptospiraceae bacterium]|nr:LysM peptidoglycan-binding domain-containing protein [Leptospiraceae bacterium]
MKFLLIFLLFLTGLVAEDFFYYKVTNGDTLSKISKEHLSDPRKWRELLKYNKISSPNLIKPGLSLKIPDSLSKVKKIETPIYAPIAKVISKTGTLKLKKNGNEDWNDITVNKDLVVNDVLRTSENSSAEIDFFEEPRTIIFLQEQSIMKIKFEEVKGIELKLGEVFIKTDKAQKEKTHFKFQTSSSTGTVKGTEYQISSDDKISRYGCYSGMIEVSAENETVKVPAGYGTIVVKGQPPMKPFKILEKVKIKPIKKEGTEK